jgi:DNA-directed RNA polymerase specialized sigma24 family protein
MPIPPPRQKIDIEEATRLHDEEGLSAAQIAQRLGFTAHAVCRAFKRIGVELRPARSYRTVPRGMQL